MTPLVWLPTIGRAGCVVALACGHIHHLDQARAVNIQRAYFGRGPAGWQALPMPCYCQRCTATARITLVLDYDPPP